MSKEEILQTCLSNKSGYYTKEKNFKKFFPEEYEALNKLFFPENFSFPQKVFHFLHNDEKLNIGVCVCGKRCKFVSLGMGYKGHCSIKCSVNDPIVVKKQEETNIKKFGVKNPFQNEEVKNKITATNINRYGTKTPSACNEVKKKIRKTCFERYGFDNPTKNSLIKEKIKRTNKEKYGVSCTLVNEDIKKKVQKTIEERYGVEFISQSDEIKKKIQRTNLERYGVEHALQSEEKRKKFRNTNLERYGVEYPIQSHVISKKIAKTNLEKYGVENVSKSEEIRNKVKETIVKKYGVEYSFFIYNPENVKQYKRISKINLKFSKKLKDFSITHSMEYPIKNRAFDFLIDNNVLVEIDPIVTHNSHCTIFGGKALDMFYHKEKTELANENGFFCLHVWDWDDKDKIVKYFSHTKKTKYCEKISVDICDINTSINFLMENSIIRVETGFDLSIGLSVDNSIVSIATFKKESSEKWKILNFCSKSFLDEKENFIKIFNYFLNNFQAKTVSITCDCSKINTNMFFDVGFFIVEKFGPMLNWYNGKEHLFGVPNDDNLSFEKEYSEMIKNNFLPLYDCGYVSLAYNNEQKK